MASNNALLNFSFKWKVDWSQYDKIDSSTPGNRPRKYFTTDKNNVVFQWYAYLCKPNENHSAMIGFGICYEDGPTETIKGVNYKIGIVQGDGSVRMIRLTNSFEAIRGKAGIVDIEDKDSAVIRTKYGLQGTDALVYAITLRIPMETFAYAPPIEIPAPIRHPILLRLADRFSSIQSPDNYKLSDAVLISRDGVEFYCHKVIVGQTEPLETLLSDPLAGLEKPAVDFDNDGTTTSASKNISTPEKIERGYKFKEMATSTLKALIEYLYTGQSTMTDLTVTDIIQLADVAEMYQLKPLKELCIVHLWKCVVDKPESAFEIASFAILHDECKYLKYRALDVIVENYQDLDINPMLLPKRFGGTRGEELTGELVNYMAKRLRPDIGLW